MAMLRPALTLLVFLTIITGGVYPLATTVLGQWWFKDQAEGSLIRQHDEVRGSRLIGQAFSEAKYFQGRPSATAEAPYNPMASGGSNLAASNPALDKEVQARVQALRAANPDARAAVPVELATASASGLDYGISPQAAFWQARAWRRSVASLKRKWDALSVKPPKPLSRVSLASRWLMC